MSQVLKLEFDPIEPDWIGFRFAHNERFLNYIQYGIRPLSYRRWNPNKKRWDIHKNKFLPAVGMGKRFFNHVDYSLVPDPLQILIVKFLKEHSEFYARAPWDPGGVEEADPYSVLHLLPTAPWRVVQAAYRALAFELHPDRGGDPAKFRVVDEAYRQLKARQEERS